MHFWQRFQFAWYAATREAYAWEEYSEHAGMVARLKAREPMLAWVRQLPPHPHDDDPDEVTLERLHREAIAFRLPPFASLGAATGHVRRRWRTAWEYELESWTLDKRLWPARSQRTFDQWFEIELLDDVVDLP